MISVISVQNFIKIYVSSHAILNTMILERSIKENVLERFRTDWNDTEHFGTN